MFDPFKAPGLRYAGEYSHPQVNHGQPLPVFEPVAPKDRPSINSLEGWKASADAENRRSFISANGREPKSSEELYAWVHQICGMLEDAV